jgi:hypothetical protein
MKSLCLVLLAFAAASVFSQQKSVDPYDPLRLYDGPWAITMHDGDKTHTDSLVNKCSRVGDFYVCQQTVNGKVGSLVVFVPAAEAGRYYVQGISREGSATGRTELNIDGSHWVYQSKGDDNGKTTWYRTANDFTGNDRIHFETTTSPDGKTWTAGRSGDEKRGN